MYYHFRNGICVATSDFAVEPDNETVTVESDAEYKDLENVRLVNGQVQHVGQG